MGIDRRRALKATLALSGSAAVVGVASAEERPAVPGLVELTPSGGDDTQAIAAACASGRMVVLRDDGGAGFNVVGGAAVRATLIGVGHPVINLLINDPAQSGFHLKTGGSIEGVHIKRTIDAIKPMSGAFGCAITTGVYAGTERCSHFAIRDVSISCARTNGGASWNAISFMGDTCDGVVENVVVDGDYLIPLMMHWGYEKSGAEVAATYHPRRIVINGLSSLNASDAVDEAKALTRNAYGLYLSGAHDITAAQILTRGGGSGVVVAIGDFGDERAAPDSVGRVMTGIDLSNVVVENVRGKALWIAGAATKIPYLAKRWLGVNYEMDVRVRGVLVLRGNGASSTAPGGFVALDHVRNVRIEGLVSRKLTGADLPDNDPVVRVTNSVDCLIEGRTISGSGWVVNSGAGIELKPVAECSHPAATSNYDGVKIKGGRTAAVVRAAVEQGAISVVMDITTDIHPRMAFEYDGQTFTFAEGAKFDPKTGKDNENVSLAIKPAPTAIPQGASVDLLTGGYGVRVHDGAVRGFHTNLVIESKDPRTPRDVEFVRIASRDAQLHDVEVRGGVGGKVDGCSFDNANLSDKAGVANVLVMADASGFDILNSRFNREATRTAYCVYRMPGSGTDGLTAGNKFYGTDRSKSSSSAIRVAGTGVLADVTGANWFGPGLSARVRE